MLSRREFFIALISFSTAFVSLSLIASDKVLLESAVYDWKNMPFNKTDVGEYAQITRQPTATLDELEVHITKLNPGVASHLPHQHVNEELVIIREGTVEVLSNGEWKRAGPGSVIFNSSNSLHALKNVGDVPAVYHVINWRSEKTIALEKQQAVSTSAEKKQ